MSTIGINTNYPKLNQIVRKVFRKYLERRYFNNFFEKISYPKGTKGNILIYAGIGHMYISPIEILMYHLLIKQGFNVDYCIYDETIPLNEVITKKVVEKTGKNVFWNRSVRNAKRILNAANVKFNLISINKNVLEKIVNIDDMSLDEIYSFQYANIDFGDIVKGVMYRYYKSLTFDNDALDVAKKFLKTALTNYLYIKKANGQKKYNYVLFSHGIYCTWQPVAEYCKLHQLDFICYDRAKTKGHCNFNLNTPSPIWDISRAWNRMADYSLNSEENKKVNKYLEERILQKNDVYSYNFSEKENDLAALKAKLGILPNRKVITIFTNLIWDAANVSRDIAFKSPIHCIESTINTFKNDDSIHIIIRTHPAEKVLGTTEQYGSIVRALYDELPDNVTIIEPEDNINSFSILDITDIGVVHTSTVGLELAIEGKATILISETHYRDKGFTYDATDEMHYYKIIDQILINDIINKKQKELARKYFYIMMFEYQHEMPMVITKKGVFDGYGYNNFNDYLEAKGDLNRIISRIANVEMIEDFIFR